jgi:hypothetical protein
MSRRLERYAMGAQGTAENLLEKVASLTAGRGTTQVTASCFALGVAPKQRYEILLEGGGERAVFDVPRGVDPHALLPIAAELFADSLLARH